MKLLAIALLCQHFVLKRIVGSPGWHNLRRFTKSGAWALV